MARRKLSHNGTLVLDCEGLSKLLTGDESVVALVGEARQRGVETVICALTIIEAVHGGTHPARLAWVLSGLRVVAVGEEESKAAATLLAGAGLHGHKYAIDAAVAAVALRQRRPVLLATSDIDDMSKLCGDHVRLVAV
ncbi:DNA-binding protein [Streptomyces durbertensis]|uniref:DNA-binding protein n=1 Tax=Streptomyces durbertensis TaxID=2448886 RepID=A0ABR6EBP9_9ACTN|nr:DNA-binding protein [Streptomyces durbertensis]MBB1242765.1 DNA-binding protein [Streptomyces durbertensis]